MTHHFLLHGSLENIRALTPLFGNGAGAHGIGKISVFSTKFGKIYILYMYEVSNARLIPIVNLTLFLVVYKIFFNRQYLNSGTILVHISHFLH